MHHSVAQTILIAVHRRLVVFRETFLALLPRLLSPWGISVPSLAVSLLTVPVFGQTVGQKASGQLAPSKPTKHAIPPASVAGVYRDSEGNPVPDAAVLLMEGNRHSSGHINWQQHAASSTDENGAYQIDDTGDFLQIYKTDAYLAEIYHRLIILVKKPGYGVISHSAPLGRSIELPLPDEGVLSGVVTDTLGNPVPNATVKLLDRPGEGVLEAIKLFPVATDEQGRYVISGLPEVDFSNQSFKTGRTVWVVAATHGEYGYSSAVIERLPSSIHLQLKKVAAIEGRAVWNDGRPVSGAIVKLKLHRIDLEEGLTSDERILKMELQQVNGHAVTDASGSYSFTSVPLADYTISVYPTDTNYDGPPAFFAENDLRVDCETAQQTVRAADLLVSAGRLVRIQLVDSESRQPLEFSKPMAAAVHFNLKGNGNSGISYPQLQCSEAGVLEFRIPESAGELRIYLRELLGHLSLPSWRDSAPIPIPRLGEVESATILVPVTRYTRK